MARIADPVSLGLAGFAAATFTVSTILAGWFDARDLAITIPLLLVFGGVAQFVAGLWSFARSNVLASVTFCSFGAFYAALALLLWMQTARVVNPIAAPGSDQAKVAGVFILMFALIAAYLCLAALGVNWTFAAVLGLLTLAYLGDGTGLWIGGRNFVLAIGGYAGLVSAMLAFYLSAAIVINSVRRREVLPVFAAGGV
jgi:succinate-acetate transporter protein